ncbi:MAG: amidase family protein, partial [Pseudomonadota bacterium]
MRTAVFALFLGVFTACSLGDTHPSRSAPYDLGPRDTASDLAIKIRNGEVSAEDALLAYLARIDANDRQGANLQSIIALNPNALAEARRLDREARAGQFRGRLHGVPVLVKDNIETKELPTTAGSMALLANDTGRDAPIVARLRAEGAIILGKTNLSEWANFRSNRSISGWSAVGGLTRNPHSLDRSACGSSSGSGAAIAANFAPLALGTETNGSITCPAAMTGTVGFKPTIGLLPRTHIVPLSPVQDSAGPMTRTVRDAALMLTIMAGTDADDPATKLADEKRIDYVEALERDLTGLRIGVFRWAEGDRPAISSAFSEAVAVLEKEGATLVDISEFEPDPVMWMSGDTVLRTEFKHALNAYLADTAPAVTVRSLNDLIAFNLEQADRELALFDQSILIESADAPALDDP